MDIASFSWSAFFAEKLHFSVWSIFLSRLDVSVLLWLKISVFSVLLMLSGLKLLVLLDVVWLDCFLQLSQSSKSWSHSLHAMTNLIIADEFLFSCECKCMLHDLSLSPFPPRCISEQWSRSCCCLHESFYQPDVGASSDRMLVFTESQSFQAKTARFFLLIRFMALHILQCIIFFMNSKF